VSRYLTHLRQSPVLAAPVRDYLIVALRGVVAAVFLIASAGKLLDFAGLTRSVSRLGWVPADFVALAAALLLAAELSAAMLLMSGRGLQAGALLGGVLAAGFMAVTVRLIARGVSSGCDCFGLFIKLPPTLMLAVDLTLFLACVALLALCAAMRPADSPISALSGTHGLGIATLARKLLSPRQPVVSFMASAYLVAMAVGLLIGFDREHQIVQAAQRRTVTLRNGDPAPGFVLRDASGKLISSASLRGKWSLICFVQPGCAPCERELSDIAKRYSAWKPFLNVLVVLTGRPAFVGPTTAVRRLAWRLRSPLTVASDPDREVAASYCDHPMHTPFSVLLDSHGTVRFIRDGRKEDRCHQGAELGVASDVDSILNDDPLGPAALAGDSAAYGRRAPEGRLWIGRRIVRLSDLWRRGPVLLTLTAAHCAACPAHLAFLKRAIGDSHSTTPVYLFPDRREAASAAERLRGSGLVAADQGGALYTAYQAGDLPETFLIKDGRLLYTPGERSSSRELESLLRGGRTLATVSLPPLAGPQAKWR
jgi:peroxiredoxin